MKDGIRELIISVLVDIFEYSLLFWGINLAFMGSLGLIFVSNWESLIPLVMFLIGLFLIIRFVKVIKADLEFKKKWNSF